MLLETKSPFNHRISVPNHKPLKVGTLSTLVRLIADHKGVTKLDILNSIESRHQTRRRSRNRLDGQSRFQF